MLKQLLYFSACTVFAHPLVAQRNADLSVAITSPANDTVVTANSPFSLTVQITDNGPDDLLNADSLFVYMTVDGVQMTFQPGNSDHSIRTGNTIDAGNSYSFTMSTVFADGFANSAHNLCISVFPQNAANPVSDLNPNNNEACVVITVTESTAGLAKNEAVVPNVFPNPAFSEVSLGVSPDEGLVRMAEVNGKQVFSFVIENQAMDVRNIPSGMYLLQFTVKGVMYIQRLAVLHE